MALWHGPLSFVIISAVAGVAWAGIPLEWSEETMEVNRYTIARDGAPQGEIHQQLVGITGPDGTKRLKVVYELARNAIVETGQEVLGRMSMQVVFDPETFDLYERADNFSAGDETGQVRYTRTPTGVQVHSDSEAQGIQRESEDWSFSYDVSGSLIDQTILVYYIRGLPLKTGHTFSISTVNPAREGVQHLKGLVRDLKTIVWNGTEVEAYLIDTATASGVTTYYVRPDARHTLVRYTAESGEIYELRLPEEKPAAGQ
jgi:hypothetical protein